MELSLSYLQSSSFIFDLHLCLYHLVRPIATDVA